MGAMGACIGGLCGGVGEPGSEGVGCALRGVGEAFPTKVEGTEAVAHEARPHQPLRSGQHLAKPPSDETSPA